MVQSAHAQKEYDLERVDFLRERMNVGYREARDALAAAGGNVVDALVLLEGHHPDFDAVGRELAEKISEVIVDGRKLSDVRVKLFDKTVCQMPTALVGFAAALIVVFGELVSHCSVDWEYDTGGEPQGTADDVVTD